MAQPQPRRDDGMAQGKAPAATPQEPIKYGDAFSVKGELARQPIAPRDAAAMRSAEASVPGVQVPQESGGGFSAGAFMESAAQYNEAVGAVRPGQASDAAAKHGVNVTQDAVPGGRIVTEFVAGQVVGQYAVAEAPAQQAAAGPRPLGLRAVVQATAATQGRTVGPRAPRRRGAAKMTDVEATLVTSYHVPVYM